MHSYKFKIIRREKVSWVDETRNQFIDILVTPLKKCILLAFTFTRNSEAICTEL